jgi:uncharacterized membrane protein YhhN
VASAALAIATAPWALAMPWLHFVFKPAAAIVIIAFAWQRVGRAGLRRWVLAGLLRSLVGGLALLWPKEGSLPSLLSFLLARLACLAAFKLERR